MLTRQVKMSVEKSPELRNEARTIDLGEPTEEMLEYARIHLGESPDTRACVVQRLTDMIYEKGEVTPHRMDEEYLIRFLRCRHFNVDKAHELIVKYYNFKENNKHLVEGVSPWEESLAYIRKNEIVSALPHRDQKGRRILIIKIGLWDPSKCTVNDILKANLMLLECALLEQRTQIYGGVVIFDMKGLSLKHTWYLTPSVANSILQLMGVAVPVLLQEVHIIHQPRLYDLVFAMFKPMLTARMRSLVHFHGYDHEAFHKFINPKCLTEEYGGAVPKTNFDEWLSELTRHPIILKELDNLGYSNVYEEEQRDSSANGD